ncbi:putative glycolipid-binding domain-containing protein [Pseudonocardia nigra]|uniref:putative glycolipid-binding domain-containing protein n=1 Tax=Pseudonocardia nigra TaxID=1921578 RepID=UPI001FEAB9BE|nr:putative glycolipid-binding domain-containing protein [Pseudonocardia nigra]
MLTWQADDGRGLEGTRLLLGTGGFRALGRMVRVGAGGEFTASYRLIVGEDGRLARLSVTSATAEKERHLTLNRTDDGVWLVDTGAASGGTRGDFAGALDVDLAYSPMFNSLPIRRLGLHRKPGEHVVPMVFVSLPDLEMQVVEQVYRTVSVLDDESGHALVEFRWGDFSAELVVDADGVVSSYPGLARRLSPGVTPAAG